MTKTTYTKRLANGTVDATIEITEPAPGVRGQVTMRIREFGKDSLTVVRQSTLTRASQVEQWKQEAFELGYDAE